MHLILSVLYKETQYIFLYCKQGYNELFKLKTLLNNPFYQYCTTLCLYLKYIFKVQERLAQLISRAQILPWNKYAHTATALDCLYFRN